MLSLVLLFGKFLFLAVLYLFVIMVVRSGARDLKDATEARVSPGRQRVGVESSGAPSAGAPGRDHAAATRGAWALVVDASPVLPVGSVITLYPGERVVIGRAPESDVVLSDTFVSSRHASVAAEDDGLVVEDLGSTNGTLVGGRDVEGRLFVGPGETVAIGDTVFVVEER